MNKQDMLKTQTCVLRVNIHCDGCGHKVKKKLQKVKGVSKVNIDAEQGKVTVTGDVDPATLIEKLEKAGKHAELWGPQKGRIPMVNLQIEKINFSGKDSKSLKGQKKKAGVVAPHNKVSKDAVFSGKDNKNPLRFNNLSEDDEFQDSDEDEDEDEFDEDEGFAAHQPHRKLKHVAGAGAKGFQANKGKGNDNGGKGKKGGGMIENNGGKGKKGGSSGKKGGGIGVFLKGVLGKGGGRNQNEEVKTSEKYGKFVAPEVKKGSTFAKSVTIDGGVEKKDKWSKKLGEKFDGRGPNSGDKQLEFDEMTDNYRDGGRNTGVLGQVGNFQASAMNAGHFQGIGYPPPAYNQQQQHDMARMMMMMMNQQSGNSRHDAYHPRLQPPTMTYGPPPMVVADQQYTHIFSDENTESCVIM